MPEHLTEEQAGDAFERAVADADENQNRDLNEARDTAQHAIDVVDASTAPPSPPTAAAIARPTAPGAAAALMVAATFDLRQLTLDQIWGLAKMVALMEMCPRGLRRRDGSASVADIAFVLIKGAELELSMTVSLAEISVIDGKLVLSAHLQHALVVKRAKPKIFRIIESTEQRAVLEVQRQEWDTPTTVEFTMAEAIALGLPDRGKDEWAKKRNAWRTQPKNMLRRRVIARGAREFFGDVVIAYDPDEFDRDEVETTPAPVAWMAPAGAASAPPSAPRPAEPAVVYDPSMPEPVLSERLQAAYTATMRAIGEARDRRELASAMGHIKPLADAVAKGDTVAKGAVDELRRAYDARLSKWKGGKA